MTPKKWKRYPISMVDASLRREKLEIRTKREKMLNVATVKTLTALQSKLDDF